MRGMKTTRLPGSGRRKAGVGVNKLTDRQQDLLTVCKSFRGEFTMTDIANKTGQPVQRYGITMRALIRMGYCRQTYRSPSSREPNRYEVVIRGLDRESSKIVKKACKDYAETLEILSTVKP